MAQIDGKPLSTVFLLLFLLTLIVFLLEGIDEELIVGRLFFRGFHDKCLQAIGFTSFEYDLAHKQRQKFEIGAYFF